MTAQLHPVDWFNLNGNFRDIFRLEKAAHIKSDTEVCYPNPEDLNSSPNSTTFRLDPSGSISVMQANPFRIAAGSIISKFTLLAAIKYKGDYRAAESYVMFDLMEMEVPYMRVGTSYYKRIEKPNRWGGSDIIPRPWKKDEIKEDHGKPIFKFIPKYDDFIIEPDNINFRKVFNGCYNQYYPFRHTPDTNHITEQDIPWSIEVMRHIFGDHIKQGWTYMKCLYEHPKQKLPVLVLVSKEQKTGKSTFSNWLYILYGENSVKVSPEQLNSEFNSSYATKNILIFEETMIEKTHAAEKIKDLVTTPMISVRDLYASAYTIPFYGHLIMCTNRVYDFIRLDEHDERYWPIYINPIQKEFTGIYEALHQEAPKFLKYLQQLPPVDLTAHRLVIPPQDRQSDLLGSIKHESKSSLRKDIEMHIDEYFNQNGHKSFFLAGCVDIKKEWFDRDSRIGISYISKVLRTEMGMRPEKQQRYTPFNDEYDPTDPRWKNSTPFKFENPNPDRESNQSPF